MDTTAIITAVLSLIGILAVGVVVPFILVQHAAKERREDAAEAARQHREDRDAEWKRQDDVAAKAEKIAQDIADRANEAAKLLLENNERVAITQLETNGKLDVIHELVNSNMTAEMQARFEATKRELAVMREIMELKKANGLEPTPEVLAAIETTRTALTELESALSDRRKAQDRINHELAGGGSGA